MSSPSSPTPADLTPDPDLSGRQFGDYRLLRRLGRGAMAEVYLAEQRSLRRQVAFKVLKRQLAKDQSYVQRFHNEAQAAAALVHANIVQIHEVGQLDSTHFIVQEYVPGKNLSQYLSRHGPLEMPLAVGIMRQVAAALQKAGERGIVHRDVKPENILLSANGEIKVADFGLARIADDARSLNLTQAGITMGTPLYMSPEQAEGRPLDTRSDIYSFGVTCYHMLAGRPPFTGETALSVAVQHLKSVPEPLDEIRADLPELLCEIVHCMLAKDPGERFQQAAELVHQLRQLPIESLDADGLEHWTATGLTAQGTTRIETTQRLSALMKASATPIAGGGGRWMWTLWLLAATSLALSSGAAVAWMTSEPPLLRLTQRERAQAFNLVQRKNSIEAQYLYALRINTEEAWRSVWKHFPGDQQETYRVYEYLAKLQLARLYMRPDYDDPETAMKLFTELAGLDDTQQEFRAHGLAGQATVHYLRSQYKEAARLLRDLKPLQLHLDELTRQRVKKIESSNRKALRGTSAMQGGGPEHPQSFTSPKGHKTASSSVS